MSYSSMKKEHNKYRIISMPKVKFVCTFQYVFLEHQFFSFYIERVLGD